MTDRLLDVDRLVAGYDGQAVVHDISLSVGVGELVALFGPNGAGKSTTLLTISGLVKPMNGEIRFEGEPEQRRANKIARAGIAHVPEERSLFPSLTVAEHLRLANRSDAVPNSKLFEWLPALGPLADRRAGLLSGGEQQMLAVARALKSRPKLLMVDEMSLGLAPLVASSLLATIGGVARDTGCGVLLVEQHVPMALTVVDRAYVMSRGRIVDEGSAADLSEDPSRLEASYLG
jgi:branched-chain amino acid transport system ATP-binding protein